MFTKTRSILPLALLFTTLTFTACSPDAEIKKMMENMGENEMQLSVVTFDLWIEKGGRTFTLTENNEIVWSDAVRNVTDETIDIHEKYHNETVLPRNGAKWKKWIYYCNTGTEENNSEESSNKKEEHPCTLCPYCRNEALGLNADTSDRYRAFMNSYLWLLCAGSAQKELFAMTHEAEIRNNLKAIKADLDSYAGFSTDDQKNAILVTNRNGQKYYYTPTDTYSKNITEMRAIHDTCHKVDCNSTVWNALFYGYDEYTLKMQSGQGTLCPYCYYIMCRPDIKKPVYASDIGTVSPEDLYFWQGECFGNIAFTNYVKKTEEQKAFDAIPEISIDTILDDISANIVTAMDKYDDKTFKVTGKIVQIDQDRVWFYNWVPVYLNGSDIRKVKTNQYITVIATADFEDGIAGKKLTLKNCRLLNAEDSYSEEELADFLRMITDIYYSEQDW